MPKIRWVEPRFAFLAVGVAAAIVYGSLFPFDYRPNGAVFKGLLATTWTAMSFGETVANILFYVPFGLAAGAALKRIPAWANVCMVILLGAAFSTCMEAAQAHVVRRNADMWDIYSNTAGTFLGAAAGAIYRSKPAIAVFGIARHRPFVWLMLTFCVGYELFPYRFSADPAQLKSVLAPLFRMSDLSVFNLFQKGTVWLMVALLLEALVGASRSRWFLGWVTLGVLGMQTLLAGFILPPEQVWSGAAAVLLWTLILWRLPRRGAILAAFFVIQIVLAALRPFHFLAEPRHFQWIPFVSFLAGNRDSGARSFLDKSFTYGTLVWVLVRAGWRLGPAAFWATALVLALRLAQIYLPGRSAEITDAILTLVFAGLMKLLNENPAGDQAQSFGEATKRYPMPRTVSR